VENKGISITGGTVSAGAMAAGSHAVAVNQTGPPADATLDDVRQALRALTRLVADSASSLDDPEQALTVARLAEQEGAKEQPDKGRLTGLLQVLSSGAGAVAGLAGAVTAVEKALQAVL
jgi:hypothetical protein